TSSLRVPRRPPTAPPFPYTTLFRSSRLDPLGNPRESGRGGGFHRRLEQLPLGGVGFAQDIIGPRHAAGHRADPDPEPGELLCAQVVYDRSHPVMTARAPFRAPADHSRVQV